MLTVTITNESSTESIGAGTATPLPAPFDWLVIAASGDATPTCRVTDILKPGAGDQNTGFACGDILQQMVQMGQITVSFANLAATLENDVEGDAIAAET